MPYSIRKLNSRYHLTDPKTGAPAVNRRTGKRISGKGHSSWMKAERQREAIMASEQKRGK